MPKTHPFTQIFTGYLTPAVLFEIKGVEEDIAREAMRLAANKLPVKCKFVKKEEEMGGEQ